VVVVTYANGAAPEEQARPPFAASFVNFLRVELAKTAALKIRERLLQHRERLTDDVLATEVERVFDATSDQCPLSAAPSVGLCGERVSQVADIVKFDQGGAGRWAVWNRSHVVMAAISSGPTGLGRRRLCLSAAHTSPLLTAGHVPWTFREEAHRHLCAGRNFRTGLCVNTDSDRNPREGGPREEGYV
jgi:hypothetical protein